MKDIVFVQPPMKMEQRYGSLAAAGATAPPYGICYLAAVARKHGYRAHIIDAEASRLTVEEAAAAALSLRPSYAGFTATTLTLRNAARIARLIKDCAPSVHTIVGGCHVTALPVKTLETYPEFDIGVIGEGEDTLIELLRRLDEGGDPENVKGLALRRKGVVRTPPRPHIEDLDSLPMPAFDLLPPLKRHYRPNAQSVASLPAISLMTSRGCFGQCTFCDRSVMGNKLRFHGAPFVLDMIKHLRDRHDIRSISFEDDIFLALRGRLEEMASLWDKRLDTAWTCASRVDIVDEATLRLAKRLGCWQVLYGVESGSQKILDLYDKRITLDQIERVTEMSGRAGLYTKGFLMIGNPLETLETLDETRTFAKRIALDDIALSFFTPFPGAALYREWRKYGTFDDDPEKMTGSHCLFVPRGLSKEILEHHERKILMEFYGRVPIVWSYLRRTKDPRRLMALVPSAVGLAKHVLRISLFIALLAVPALSAAADFLRETADTLRAHETGIHIRTPLPDGGWTGPHSLGREKSLAFVYNQLAAREYGKAIALNALPARQASAVEMRLTRVAHREEDLLKEAEAMPPDTADAAEANPWSQAKAYAKRFSGLLYQVRTPAEAAGVRGGRKLDKIFEKALTALEEEALNASRDATKSDDAEKARFLMKTGDSYSQMVSAALIAAASPDAATTLQDKVVSVKSRAPSSPAKELSARQIYKETAPGVVLVHCRGKDDDGELGTGSVINEEGDILTNAHVVLRDAARNPYDSIRVYFKPDVITGDPRRDLTDPVSAEVIKADWGLDLAVLRLAKPPRRTTILPLGDAQSVRPGDPVSAIGHPEQGGLWTLTTGVVRAGIADFGGVPGKNIFQTDLPIDRGDSGGPLLDSRGIIIGVNTSMARRDQDGLALTSASFSVRSSVVMKWLAGGLAVSEAPVKSPAAKAKTPAAERIETPPTSRTISPKRPYKRYELIRGLAP